MALICVAVTLAWRVMALLSALVVPSIEYTTPMRRFVEMIEYALLLAQAAWALWLLNLLPVIPQRGQVPDMSCRPMSAPAARRAACRHCCAAIPLDSWAITPPVPPGPPLPDPVPAPGLAG